MRRALIATLAFVLLPALVMATKVKVWHHHTSGSYEAAVFKQAVLTSEGTLQLARQLRQLPGIEVAHVWAVAEDAASNLYVATGNEGKLFKLTSDGTVTVVFTSEDSQILSLAIAPDGSVYAGTGPSGFIVRVAPDGTAKTFCQLPDAYVWCLASDHQGDSLYAGTGPKGRVYQVARDGKASTFYTTKQDHVLSLAFAPDGQLFAGTDKHGLVYRIDPKGKGFVVFDAPQSEVRTLLVGKDAVYAGTSSPSNRHSPGVITRSADNRSASTSGNTDSAVPASLDVHRSPDKDRSATLVSETKEKASAGTRPASGSSPGSASTVTSASPAAAGENSVYRIVADGTVREVFREKAMILSLLQRDDRLLIGTGGDGQLFELRNANRERTELARLDHSQIHCLFQRRDGSVVIGAGDPGKVYVLEDKFAPKGTVRSDVLDAKGLSRWGALRWSAEMPPGTTVSVATRSGNVAEPDETWSDWSPEQSDAQHSAVASPPARYFQYRVTLASTDAHLTPTLSTLTVRYMTTNVAPEVGAIDVPDLDAVTSENPKKLKIKWKASDANEDELTFNLSYRKEGWKNWVELESDLEKPEYEWDTTTTPAGVYQLKVVASDRKDNDEEHALTGERVSGPFVVDHVPPVVSLKVAGIDGDQAVIEATATDGLTRLVSASFSVDSRKWTGVFPTDGLFDSKSEAFRFKTESLKPGTHVLVMRATDAAGNTGSIDVVFQVQAKTAR